MKTKLIISPFIGLLSLTMFSQNWEQLSIPESPSRYDDVFFLNENLGWAADGAGSAVYKTIDGGLNWTESTYNNDEYLRNIEFLNENIGFLGALSQNMYKTTDGGTTWELIFDLQGAFEAVCGLDTVGESTVYGCGTYFEPAFVIKSSDSGETWDFIDMSAYANSLVEILFVDEQTGFTSGGNDSGGVILKTTNGGQTWTEIYNTGIPGEQIWKLQILHSNPNVMFGSVQSFDPLSGKLIKSTDGGQNWISKPVPDPAIQGVGFITENHGWMGGHNSGFLETFDGGETWTNTGFGWSLNRFQIFNENLVYCSGQGIYKYTDNLAVSDIVTERPEDLAINVVPNPVSDKLNVSIDFKRSDHMVITLFDETGRLIKQLSRETIAAKGIKNYSFDFPFKPGVYYVLFHYDVGYQSKKIIKK